MRRAIPMIVAISLLLMGAIGSGAAFPSTQVQEERRDDIAAGEKKDAKDSLMAEDSLMTEESADADSGVAKIYTKAELRQMRRDSVKNVRDSIKTETPRVLLTSAFPDSLAYKRILVWNSDSKVNDLKLIKNDSTFNDWFTENQVFKRDIDAVYLGMSGSAALSTNWFKRTEFSKFKGYEPWVYATYLPETMQMYNVKSTYTELAYWGTLFAFKDKEEGNVRVMHTQNVTPALNLAFLWQSYGGKGLLTHEETHNKTLAISGNHLGKHYVANFGFIHNNIYRDENGGVSNTYEVRDTTIEAKAVAVRMTDAHNAYSRNSFFIHHHYSLAFRDVKKYFEEKKVRKVAKGALEAFLADSAACAADSIGVLRDSLMTAAGMKGPTGERSAERDSISRDDGSMFTFGHIGEVSRFYRKYTDNISESDTAARRMYNDCFFIDPNSSSDSTRTFSIENKVFVRMQPWGRDAIVSKVDAGIGHEFVSHYAYRPDMSFLGNYNDKFNNAFVYGGASGKYRKYLNWSADVRYDFLGYTQNDMEINAAMTLSFFPFKKDRSAGVDFTGRFSTSLKRPDYFSNWYYSNHYIWDNDFSKVSKMKIEGQLDINRWRMSIFFGYGITGNYVYYGFDGNIQQHNTPINVISAYIRKDFVLWKFHLDNQVLGQISSDQDIMPLPLLTAHLRWYIEFPIVSPEVMKMQIGVDAIYNTKYYMPMWNPAIGQYQIQDREKLGGTPYMDVFVNVQWKRVCLFLKVTNVAQGWPDGDYFSAYSYIRPTRNFKLGIFWPFYFK